MINKVIRRKKQLRVFAFIDNQNLNQGVRKTGWNMDWRKLRAFLTKEHGVSEAFMFIGYVAENEDLYKQMYDAGFNVILKPTVGMFESKDKKEIETKGNVDTDLVLECMKQWKNYDRAIIISGDGDYYGLIEHLKKSGKLGAIMVPNWKYSSLLKEFEKHVIRLDQLKQELAYHKSPKKSRRKPAKQKAGGKDKKQSSQRTKR
ncbi:MAG: NYN domain-containing protein [Patescibacteria group bacterium]